MKKRTIFNLILVALIGVLIFALVKSIEEPIAFKDEKEKREAAVVERLITIRNAQKLFYGIKDGYAPSFDSLKKVLKTDTFKLINIIGDPDDPDNPVVTYDTAFVMAADSIATLGLILDSIEYVPYADDPGLEFEIKADTTRSQKTLVSVVEVGIRRNKFMGKFGDKKYQKYDDNYDPAKKIKFGDLNKPSLSGNWESK